MDQQPAGCYSHELHSFQELANCLLSRYQLDASPCGLSCLQLSSWCVPA